MNTRIHHVSRGLCPPRAVCRDVKPPYPTIVELVAAIASFLNLVVSRRFWGSCSLQLGCKIMNIGSMNIFELSKMDRISADVLRGKQR